MAIAILSVLIVLFLFILSIYYTHHGFSSGNWFNDEGDALVIRNRGLLDKSEMLIAEQSGDKYNVLKYKCRMLVNPIALPHKFTLYIYDDMLLRAEINMLTGKLNLFKNGKHYGTFSKSNINKKHSES
jgi:hypothetical protein